MGPIRRLRAALRALWADFDGLWDLDDVYEAEIEDLEPENG